jgi:hypothetical protein
MKYFLILIIVGVALFLIGTFVLAYEIFGGSNLKWSAETEVSTIFYVIVPGLAILGIGIVLEFAKKEWS